MTIANTADSQSVECQAALPLNLYFVLPNGAEFGTTVKVNRPTGRFDGDRAFEDLLRFCELDSAPETTQYLQIGGVKLPVVDVEINGTEGEMPMRVADLEAFKRAVATMGMDKPACQSDEEWEAELAMLEAWQWDGRHIQDITQRFDLINIHLPNKRKEWAHTVPVEWRGKVFYVESSNPVNSEEEVRRFAEILAVDDSGDALLFKTYHNTYTDDEAMESAVMPIAQAKALIEDYRQRKAAQDAHQEQDEVEQDDAPRLSM